MARPRKPVEPNPFDTPTSRQTVKAAILTRFTDRRRNQGVKYQLFTRDGAQFMYGSRDRWQNKNVMLNTAAHTMAWNCGLPFDYQVRENVTAFVRTCLEEMVNDGELIIREVQ